MTHHPTIPAFQKSADQRFHLCFICSRTTSACLPHSSLGPQRAPMNRPASPFDVEDDSDSSSSEVALSPFLSRRPSLSSATSTSDVSMRSSVSSAASVWSMTDSMREQAFKQEYGRGINNYSDVYKLPADEEELERLGAFAYLVHSSQLTHSINTQINSISSLWMLWANIALRWRLSCATTPRAKRKRA